MAKRRSKRIEVSPLSSHKKSGKILKSPMSQFGGMQFSSWVNEVLPEMLWAALLLDNIPRETCIEKFRGMLRVVEANKEALTDRKLELSDFAKIDEAVFDALFADLCKEEEVGKALSHLLLLESLPGLERWKKHLTLADDDTGGDLTSAVAMSYNHQSSIATDCQWLRVITENAKGRLQISSNVAQMFQDVLTFPEHAEPERVGGSVRALEMTTRGNVEGRKLKPFAEAFWKECWDRSECETRGDPEYKAPDHKDLISDIHDVYGKLITHYMQNTENTLVDARREGAFGLVFYIMHLSFLALKSTVGQTVQGRLTLRSAVETLITLKYLSAKNDPTIWLQYRNYGASQSKLAYLKYDEANPPAFVSRELLEDLANADIWMEHQDIKLGAWADKNLRTMATDAGVKPLYDKYYDGLSGYVHGNWSAVSHTTFQVCVNPLHRFHQIPVPARFFIDDATPDLVSLINLALEEVTKLYPPFKPRVGRPKETAQEADATEAIQAPPRE